MSKPTQKRQKAYSLTINQAASTKVAEVVCKWCAHLEIWMEFTIPMGTQLGPKKSHWGPPGGHLSSQGRLLEGIFYGLFLHETWVPKLTQKAVFFGPVGVAKA